MVGDAGRAASDPARVRDHALERLLPRRARPPSRVPGGERPDARSRGGRARRARRRSSASTSTRRRSRRRRRCLDLGARGIKLHPRAQRFLPDDPRLEPVFALAAERTCPILIHGGRGLPPIADSLGSAARPPLPARADRRARRDRRPRGDGAELRGAAGRVLRHVGLEPARPARPLPPRAARAGRLRLGLPVRPPAQLAADGGAHGPRVAGSTTTRCARCSTTRPRASRTGSSPFRRARRRARRSSRTRSRSSASTST